MTLRDLLAEMDVIAVHGNPDVAIAGLSLDSRTVRTGDAFFALGGVRRDGAAYVDAAIAAGAAAAVVARGVPAAVVPSVEVAEPRLALAQAAARFYGHPSRELAVVGITGTNGKTTTTWMLESIFRAAGRRPGVIGTTGYRIGEESRPAPFTTPEAPQLHGLLREMVDRGVEAVAIELSSHALVQRRCYGLDCDVAVFTNLTQDHLDYHGDMDAYLDAKLMLFDGRNGPSSKPEVAVVNADDPACWRFASAAARGGLPALAYSGNVSSRARDLAVAVTRVEPVTSGLRLTLRAGMPHASRAGSGGADPGDLDVTLPLLGRYNASNAAAACAAALALGIGGDPLKRGLESMPGVPGRLERVSEGRAFDVVVDYAHTPDALSRALAAVREHFSGRLLLVFGCGGDRDRAKRPLMGRAAAAGSDRAWITNDNPRGEDPGAIALEIMAGAQGAAFEVELDRRAAIARAIDAARHGDVVLVAGKGHETTQTIGDRVTPFDDRAVARELLLAGRGGGA